MLCELIPKGTLNGACYGNGTCDEGFDCINKVCAKSAPRAEPKKQVDVPHSDRVSRRGTTKPAPRTKARELPGLRRLGLVMVDAHPRWELTLERPDVIELTNKGIGVVFTVTT